VGEFAASKHEQTLGRRITKALPYLAVLVLVAGGIAFLIAYYGNTADTSEPTTRAGQPQDNSGVPRNVPVPKAARTVAAQYVLSTLTRRDMAKSWDQTHPELKNGFTRKQWLSGDVPVPVFPAKAFAGASYRVQWSHPDDVMLDVYVFAKPKQATLSQAFFIETKPVGTGDDKRWLVSYVAPNGGAVNTPNLGSGG
jgi:hypothetical protein